MRLKKCVSSLKLVPLSKNFWLNILITNNVSFININDTLNF